MQPKQSIGKSLLMQNWDAESVSRSQAITKRNPDNRISGPPLPKCGRPVTCPAVFGREAP